MTKSLRIASLACSFNRREKTATFLRSLSAQHIPEGYTLDIYLLDDNSSDGTAEYVRKNFPSVTVINGNGWLYWAGGMRKVWGEALKNGPYDFYLLLNDDVTLADNALDKLLEAYHKSPYEANIILGSVRDAKTGRVTYGGRRITSKINGKSFKLQPDENELLECEIGNANVMLVDNKTVNKIGILSGDYTHSLADFDYTLTAVKNGIKVWVGHGYYGYCENDHGVPWLPQKNSLKKRIKYLYSPTGLAYKEYITYVRKHFPYSLPEKFLKIWIKTLFPIFYDKFKQV